MIKILKFKLFHKIFFTLCCTFLLTQLTVTNLLAEVPTEETRSSSTLYTYINKTHSTKEHFENITLLYGLTWGLYPLTQWETVKDHGSWQKWNNNLGRLVFDKDEPTWNWFVHPYSGSQLYLYYRADGYSSSHAILMSFISSSLFEFTVEIYTEPASVQDLYQTPVFGAILGYGIENVSMFFLNSGNPFAKVIGHIMNPATMLWFYEGKIQILPIIEKKNSVSLSLWMDF